MFMAALALCAAATTSIQAQEHPSASEPEVETVGSGERRVPPDRASVMLLVETKANTAAEAAALNSRAVQSVRDTLRRAALDSVLATASYNVGPNYEPNSVRGEPQRRGYAARTVLRIQLTRLDQVRRVIDVALAKGATGVEGVAFESSTAQAARREALADAAVAARRDAEALARALGGTIGPLIATSTASSFDPRRVNVMMESSMGRATSTRISPSEIIITAGVVTRWRFIPSP
jgi:uncharacterized protein YggE